jgi:hypothetical protein
MTCPKKVISRFLCDPCSCHLNFSLNSPGIELLNLISNEQFSPTSKVLSSTENSNIFAKALSGFSKVK